MTKTWTCNFSLGGRSHTARASLLWSLDDAVVVLCVFPLSALLLWVGCWVTTVCFPGPCVFQVPSALCSSLVLVLPTS